MGDDSIRMKRASPEQSVFAEALQLTAPGDRASFLKTACGTDTAFRRRVEALLRAAEQAGDFLEKPPDGLATGSTAEALASELSEGPGEWIGRYRLLEQVGEGGCGVVYMAEQEEPVRRRVALKVIKPGMDTRSVVARFEAERQALAMMDHPNIAKVFDGGATQTGRPYFVMVLVRGVRITNFCEEARLPIGARLRLFVQVCQAIQHAHQKGIIHRDLKPSNILVTVNDGEPVPQVIDFGIAKATGQRLTDKTLFTHFHSFIGTPAYTSPEQAEMSNVDIDTRSDIYSLGVLLYELLTGRTPFDGEELLRSGLDEMRRVIRDVEPLRPSTRLGSLSVSEAQRFAPASGGQISNSAPGTSDRRTPPLKHLIGAVRGDLDLIVMKCLEKDRSRRYETANALAADVQRHLDHEPIQARPVSSFSRFWRWRQRHPGLALLSASVLLLLTVVAVGSAVAAWRVSSARHAEQTERKKADAANRELRGANLQLADTVNVLELRRAEEFLRANDSAAGVAQLAAMLRRDPSNHIIASRLVSALVHRNWALPAVPPIRHENRVPMIRFSPDGRHVLSASWDKTAQVHDALTGGLLFTVRHNGEILAAVYNREGDRFATASADGTARIWSATNGAPLTPSLRHKTGVTQAEFSPDGQYLITVSAEKYARLWNVTTGALKHELRGHSIETVVAGFTPDGQQVITGSRWGSIRIWSVETGQSLPQVDGHFQIIHALAFSPDKLRFASAGQDGNAQLWDLASGQRIGPALAHRNEVIHTTFSPDGALLLTTSQDDTARLWNGTNGYPVGLPLLHEGGIRYGTFSPDGRKVATASMDNSARLWDTRTGRPLCQPLRQLEAVSYASFSPDGRKLVTGSWDRTVQIWSIQPRRYRGVEAHRDFEAFAVAFHPNGETVVGAFADRTAQLWNARTGKAMGQPMVHQFRMHSVNFSPDGRRLVTTCANGAVSVWDSTTGVKIAALEFHTNTVWHAQFSPDSKQVVTASEDGMARIWDAETGRPTTPPINHGAPVNSARFSPDGRWLATASDNWSARVWDARTGRPVTERLPHIDNVEWVEFSPDSERLVSASSDNTARVWEVSTGKPISPPLQHARTVQKAVFSPDGRRVATASLDRTARIWDTRTGEELPSPMIHEKAATQISFSADGRRILTTGWAGTWRLWDAATGHPLTEWLEGGGPGETVAFDPAGARVVTGSVRGVVAVWETPPVPSPVPGWFLEFAEGVAGMRLNIRGGTEYVTRRELELVASRLAQSNEDGVYEHFGRWFLADPVTRKISPY
jgi:WD40 repeat protein/serine/threonine protein kinase